MTLSLKPNHEALLAGALVFLSLVVSGVVLAHNYPGRLPPGEADIIYQDSMLQIRGVGKRVAAQFDTYVPLGDLDKLYTERCFDLLEPEPKKPDPVALEDKHVAEPMLETEFKVTGIVWSSRRPLAFVNGRGVVKGDTFKRWTVSDITEAYVMLTNSDGVEKRIGLYDKPEENVEHDADGSKEEANADAHF
jgi:hypothetical protein